MKLSIITINYNNKAGLEKTIASVMSQTWRDFEWIIIDGGSSDGSKEVIEKLATTPQSNISYWCSEPDNGIYNALNKGIVHSEGDYLIFMNSGDYFFEKDTLKKVSPQFDKKDISVVWGKTIDSETGLDLQQQPTYEALAKTLLVFTLCHQGAFINREVQIRNLYDESLSIVADWKFFLQTLIFNKGKIEILNQTISVVEPGGVSATQIQKRIDERRKVIIEYYGKGVADLIQDYNSIRFNEITQKTNILLNNDVSLYRMVRRFLSVIMKIYDLKKRVLKK